MRWIGLFAMVKSYAKNTTRLFFLTWTLLSFVLSICANTRKIKPSRLVSCRLYSYTPKASISVLNRLSFSSVKFRMKLNRLQCMFLLILSTCSSENNFLFWSSHKKSLNNIITPQKLLNSSQILWRNNSSSATLGTAFPLDQNTTQQSFSQYIILWNFG